MKLYPLKFKPLLHEKVWGGEHIKNIYRHDEPKMERVGESWDVVALSEENDSEVINGFFAENTLSELVEVYMGNLVGDRVYEKYGNEFPMIVKVIDAADRLSVQVHPDDQMAERKGETGGKEEMWYVLDAEPGASLLLGFTQEVTPEQLRLMSENGTVESVLKRFDVKKGDVFHIPTGVVHAIGKGCLILEVQQASDVTYRMYDYGRGRELHLDDALEAIDYEHWQGRKVGVLPRLNEDVNLVKSDKFIVNIIEIDKPKEYELGEVDSFVILTCAEGHVTVKWDDDYLTLVDGETLMVPAEMDSLMLLPTVKSKIIETYIEL